MMLPWNVETLNFLVRICPMFGDKFMCVHTMMNITLLERDGGRIVYHNDELHKLLISNAVVGTLVTSKLWRLVNG